MKKQKPWTLEESKMLDLTQFEGHTPGPWWCDDYGTYIFTKSNNQMVGETRGTGANLPQEINGKLLASAPDLLAEVKRLRGVMTQLRNRIMLARINDDEIIETIDEALK